MRVAAYLGSIADTLPTLLLDEHLSDIIDTPDRDAFAQKMNAVYPKLEARWGTEHWKRMRAEIDKLRGGK
jgi:hypothetical protein